MDWDDIPEEFQGIIFLIAFIIVAWAINFFSNVGQFFGKNPLYLWGIIGILAIAGGIKFLVPLFNDTEKPAPRVIITGQRDTIARSEEYIDENVIETVVKSKKYVVDKTTKSVNSIRKGINQWKKIAPKIRGRGKERQLTLSMTGFLASKHPEIDLEHRLGSNRIDAVIGKIGIEAKHRPNQNEINRLYGQVDDYLRSLNHIIVVFFDTNQSIVNNFSKKLKTGHYSKKVTIISV